MEADVVVNFLNFFTDVEQEDLIIILSELQLAGIYPASVDVMIDKIITKNNCLADSSPSSQTDDPFINELNLIKTTSKEKRI